MSDKEETNDEIRPDAEQHEGDDSKDHPELEIDKYRMYALISFIVIIVGIGLPVWWKTTEVYRVTLPYEDIRSLNADIRIGTKVGIWSLNDTHNSKLIKELNEKYSSDENLFNIKFYKADVSDDFHEPHVTAHHFNMESGKNLKPGHFNFLEWNKSPLPNDFSISYYRTALMRPSVTSAQIDKLLRTTIHQEYKLKSSLAMIKKSRSNVRNYRPEPNIQLNSRNEIVVTVINSDPDIQTVAWDAKQSLTDHFNFAGLDDITKFEVKSHWIFHKFNLPVRQVKDDSALGYHYAISQDYLPHLLTSIEKNIGNTVSNNATIHMVIYVPSCDISPLYIHGSTGERVSQQISESFISPKWGGVVIYNSKDNYCESYRSSQQERASIPIGNDILMPVLFGMFRKFLDIESVIPDDVDAEITGIHFIRDWELDVYLRYSTVHMIGTTILTLQSLTQLLDEINNIVISDDVGNQIIDAFEHVKKAIEYLKMNELMLAHHYARLASVCSEKAFFDPSLLELLYFPNDQKYAIYIPLFLPVTIPVILSLRTLLKFKNELKKSKQD